MEWLIAGIAMAFNFIIILWKFQSERYLDAVIDVTIFACIAFLSAGTVTGVKVGMIASMLVSLYLLIKPPRFSYE